MSQLPRAFAIGSAIAVLGSPAAHAAQSVSPALLVYTATQEHRAAVMASVRPYYVFVPSCTRGTAKRLVLDVISPVSFDASGALATGAWIEGIKVDGCATSGLFNVLTMARDGEAPVVGALLPGTTRAPPMLQRDALPMARRIAVHDMPGGCGEAHVIDTAFEGFGEVVNADVPPGREARSWRERWTVAGCGRQATVTMRFVPDRTGTSFIAGS